MQYTNTQDYNEQSNRVNKVMPKPYGTALLKRLENIMSLSQLLRFIGAIAMLASMSLFMFKGWSDGNDISRYLTLLAQTGLITSAGLILSFVVKEVKGARVFFGLGLASVVANFTILGALSYSIFPIDQQLMDYPSMMRWEVTSLSTFIPTLIGALLALSVIAFFGFSVFARKFAKPLTFGFLALSMLLLIPLRAPLAAATLAMIAFVGAYFLINKIRSNERFLATFETNVSLALLLLPGSIITVRALSFYTLDNVSLLAFLALAFSILRMLLNSINPKPLFARFFNAGQMLLSVFIATLIGQLISEMLNLRNTSLPSIITTLTILGFACEQIMRTNDKQWATWLNSAVTILFVPMITLSALVGPLFFDFNVVECLLSMAGVLGLNVVSKKVTKQSGFSMSFAIFGLLACSIITAFNIVELIQLSNWVIVGIVGGMFILGASLYERYGHRLSAQSTDSKTPNFHNGDLPMKI